MPQSDLVILRLSELLIAQPHEQSTGHVLTSWKQGQHTYKRAGRRS